MIVSLLLDWLHHWTATGGFKAESATLVKSLPWTIRRQLHQQPSSTFTTSNFCHKQVTIYYFGTYTQSTTLNLYATFVSWICATVPLSSGITSYHEQDSSLVSSVKFHYVIWVIYCLSIVFILKTRFLTNGPIDTSHVCRWTNVFKGHCQMRIRGLDISKLNTSRLGQTHSMSSIFSC